MTLRGSDVSRFGVEGESTIWRLTPKAYSPMLLPPRSRQGQGRFDDPAIDPPDSVGDFSVLYCAETSTPVFLEVLSRFRKNLQDYAAMSSELLLDVHERDTLEPEFSDVMQEWMDHWHLGSADVALPQPLFDLSNAEGIQFVRERMAVFLLTLGLDDLDFGALLGSDRRLTRGISRWIWSQRTGEGEPLFSGIKYRSRLDADACCTVLFEDRYHLHGDVSIQPITTETPGFA